MIYCVVPPDAAPRLRRSIERALRGNPSVAVVHERRAGERRRSEDRRCVSAQGEVDCDERRRVRYTDGRRVAERRAVLVPVAAPELPAKVRAHAERLGFLEALQVPPGADDDVEAVRTIVRIQSGEPDAFADLYLRWFDRIYTYLRITLERPEELDSRVCAVFAAASRDAIDASPGISGVRLWLFGLAHRIGRQGTLEPVAIRDPGSASVGREQERATADTRLDWLTDDDLLLLIARRPVAERHVLLLRYLGGLSGGEIAGIMELDRSDVRDLHRRAVTSMEASLSAIVRSPRMAGRLPMSRLDRGSRVLDRRRRALLAA